MPYRKNGKPLPAWLEINDLIYFAQLVNHIAMSQHYSLRKSCRTGCEYDCRRFILSAEGNLMFDVASHSVIKKLDTFIYSIAVSHDLHTVSALFLAFNEYDHLQHRKFSSETEDLIALILVLSKSDSCVCYGKNVFNLIRHCITTSRDISASKREDTKIGSKPLRAVIADDSYIIPPLHSMRSQISRYCPGFLLKLYEGLWNESAFFILPHLYIC